MSRLPDGDTCPVQDCIITAVQRENAISTGMHTRMKRSVLKTARRNARLSSTRLKLASPTNRPPTACRNERTAISAKGIRIKTAVTVRLGAKNSHAFLFREIQICFVLRIPGRLLQRHVPLKKSHCLINYDLHKYTVHPDWVRGSGSGFK